MDTNTPAPPVDMLAQAGDLLKRYQSSLYDPTRDPTIVLASTVLAVAGELRSIHNVLHEINGHMATMAGIQYQAAAASLWWRRG